jgi:hypothetical protein
MENSKNWLSTMLGSYSLNGVSFHLNFKLSIVIHRLPPLRRSTMKDPQEAYGSAEGPSKDVVDHQTGEAFGYAEDQICLSNGFLVEK